MMLPLISLNAITGISMTKTMKLSVQLDADTVTTLVDSGSTHSFISTEAACRLHLEPAFRLDLQVTVTNGDKAPSTGVCHNVQVPH
jgi:predicted aspartyl protease